MSPAPADVLCIGESMVLFGTDEGSLVDSPTARLYVAGAEANVATGLAHLGERVEWFGRVGDDPFGARIRNSLVERGIESPSVITDPGHGTGLYFKEWVGGRSEVFYYRANSAAAQLSAAELDTLQLSERRLCHVSGITPALSPQCDEAMGALLLGETTNRPTISFDVNYRAKLWDVATAAPRILELARGADIVIVGRDEAEVLWGTATAAEIRALFPDAPVVVIKDADIGATSFIGEQSYFVPALSVEVVEPIGAGDAFAAGFLSAWLAGTDPIACLRLGHVMAAHVLGSIGDTPVLPDRAALLELASVDDDAWRSIHLPANRMDAATAASAEGAIA